MTDPVDPTAWSCPLPLQDVSAIVMGHGGGGHLSAELVQHLFLPALDGDALRELGDAAVVPSTGGRLAFTTDSFVVRPLFFPGGSIGELAVHGTVNDLAMRGAVPRFLSVAFIIEEGLPLETLGRIVERIGRAARDADVTVVTGDTKVVDRGQGDGVYVNTTGIGWIADGVDIRPDRAEPGDAVIVSGTIGDHGMAVMAVREGLAFETDIVSDTAPLHRLVAEMLDTGADLHVLRDPTRGGLASALNEIATASDAGIALDEPAIPVQPAVRAACEVLGLDPLFVANEGKLVAIVPADRADRVLERMREHPAGAEACVVGRVVDEHPGMVVATTGLGATRIVDMLPGEQLPRIC